MVFTDHFWALHVFAASLLTQMLSRHHRASCVSEHPIVMSLLLKGPDSFSKK